MARRRAAVEHVAGQTGASMAVNRRRRRLLLGAGAVVALPVRAQAPGEPNAEALQRTLQRLRTPGPVVDEAERQRRLAEREALLAFGESALARLEVERARDAFERAALITHAADTELCLVRTYMQAGEYRRATSFGAHTAGAHRDVPGGAALYAWLLHLGGQGAFAQRLLQGARERLGADPLLGLAQDLLDAPTPLAGGALLLPPARLAPYSMPVPRVRFVASGLIAGAADRALVPLAVVEGAAALWVRNGLGQVARAEPVPIATAEGFALLQLRSQLTEAAATLAERDPFPGSPGFAVEFAPDPQGEPAWPLLRIGFIGPIEARQARRALGITMPPGARGGPVLDAGGRLVGVAQSVDGRDVLVLPSALRQLLTVPVRAGPAAALPADELYERTLPLALQVLAAATS